MPNIATKEDNRTQTDQPQSAPRSKQDHPRIHHKSRSNRPINRNQRIIRRPRPKQTSSLPHRQNQNAPNQTRKQHQPTSHPSTPIPSLAQETRHVHTLASTLTTKSLVNKCTITHSDKHQRSNNIILTINKTLYTTR